MPNDRDGFVVSVVRTDVDLRDALAVRMRVFVEEQDVPVDLEVDTVDREALTRPDAVYLVGRLRGAAIATARLLFEPHGEPGAMPHIGRVAVLAEHRGRGFGAAIMYALHNEARARDARAVRLAAQLHAIPFYERLGYVTRGPVFLDAGIEHRDMDRRLTTDAPNL